MSLTISIVAAAAEHTESISPFIPAGIAFAALLFLGIVTWSYRDVSNRHTRGGAGDHDSHGAGH
jgi:hypothetical protein